MKTLRNPKISKPIIYECLAWDLSKIRGAATIALRVNRQAKVSGHDLIKAMYQGIRSSRAQKNSVLKKIFQRMTTLTMNMKKVAIVILPHQQP